MLRSFEFIDLANASMCGAWIFTTIWRVLRGSERRAVVRLLLARPLWWLAVLLLSVPDAQARYAEFRSKVLAEWEDALLGRRR